MPGAQLRDSALHLQQRQVLLPARADGGAPHAGQEDRLSGSGGAPGPTGPDFDEAGADHYDRRMLIVAAKVWHYWLSFALLAPVMLVIVGMAVAYLAKVVAQKYPRQ